MEKRVIVIRHGESHGNIGSITNDHASIQLTEKGYLQAHSIVEKFPFEPELIIHSPFPRTLETAKPLMIKFPNAKIEEWAIQEFTYLDTEKTKGTSISDRKDQITAYWEKLDPFLIDGVGAESFAELVERVQRFMKKINESSFSKIAVFSHGKFMRTLEMVMEEGDNPDLRGMMIRFEGNPVKNCEMREMCIDNKGKWTGQNVLYKPV